MWCTVDEEEERMVRREEVEEEGGGLNEGDRTDGARLNWARIFFDVSTHLFPRMGRSAGPEKVARQIRGREMGHPLRVR
jgi:hypothetical protein